MATPTIGLTIDDGRNRAIRVRLGASSLIAAAACLAIGLLPVPPWTTALLLAAVAVGLWLYNFAAKAALSAPKPSVTADEA